MAGNLGDIGTAFVTVELDFDKAFQEARTAGQTIPPVELRAELDQTQVTREVKTTLETAERSAGPITPRVEVDEKGAAVSARAAFARISKTVGAINANVRVNPASLNAAATQIRSTLGGAFLAAGAAARTAFIPGLFGVALLGDQIRRGAQDAKEMEQSLTGLRGSLRGAGKASGVTERQVLQVAGAMEEFSSVTEESIIAAQEPLTRFGVVSKKTLPETTRLMLDTAAGMRQIGTDGNLSAGFAQKFARALADPQKGLTLLSKAGVPVSKALKDNVKELVATGKQAEATALVADLLREKYSGAAKVLGESVPGQLRLAGDAFEDSRRNLAQRILPAIAAPLKTLSVTIATTLDSNREGIAKFVVGLVNGANRLVKFIATNKQFHGVMRGIAAVIKGVARGLSGFVKGFVTAFSKQRGKGAKDFGKSMENLGKTIGALAEKWLPRIGSALGTFIGWVTKTKAGVVALFGFLASAKVFGVFRTITGGAKGVQLAIRALIYVVGAFVAVFGAIPVAIAAAIAVLVVLYVKFEKVRYIINRVFVVATSLANPFFRMAALFVLLWKRSETFRNIVLGVINAVKNAIAGLRQRFAEWRAGVSLILDAVQQKFADWKAGVALIIDSARETLRNFRDRVRALLDIDLSELGMKIIKSLLSGLKEGWKEVSSWLSERASIIKKLKGPISVDRRLLFDEGDAIMGGLFKGLKRRWQKIASWLKDVGGYFKGIVGANEINIGDILLGKAGTDSLDKQIGASLGIDFDALGLMGGLGGFLHATSGWADTLAQGRLLEKMFNVSITDGLRPPGTLTASGNLSQHSLGQALDFGGSGGALTALAAFASRLRHVFKQVIWLNRLWASGAPTSTFIADHLDHTHLGWQPRAAGGQVRKGGRYKWNERGAEMFMPHGNGYVMNASRTKELIGALKEVARRPASSRSSNAEIHVHSNAADPVAVGGVVMTNLGAVFSRA